MLEGMQQNGLTLTVTFVAIFTGALTRCYGQEKNEGEEVKRSPLAANRFPTLASGPDICSYSGYWWWCAIGRDDFPLPPISVPLHKSHNLTTCSTIAGDPLYMHCQGLNISTVPKDIIPRNLTYLKISETNITKLEVGDLAGLNVDFFSITNNPLDSIEG